MMRSEETKIELWFKHHSLCLKEEAQGWKHHALVFYKRDRKTMAIYFEIDDIDKEN